MSSTLPTTPIGKQQLIDMRAGAILRGHARKSERYLGCPVRLLLTFIVLIKSSLLCAWLVREYYFFDVRCSFLSTSLGDEILKRRSVEMLRIPVYSSDPPVPSNFDEEHLRRVKRTSRGSEVSDPRMKSRREKKKFLAANLQGVPTTVVTLTNTQLLPADGDTLRMKTIRNRVEPMSDVGGDEDVVEIDIDAPPRVYISKILSRGEPPDDDNSSNEKPMKRKGKGKKKKKKLQEQITTTTAAAPPPKKQKGHRKKQNKTTDSHGTSEQTKSPRHLFSSPGLPQFTTPRPHQSNFLHGAIDPKDPQFSNKGQIRGYPMHIASRKPTPSTRLSEETRLMWEMDELNYTTYAAAPKTTVLTEVEEKEKEEDTIISVVELTLPEASEPPATMQIPERKSFYATHTLSTWKLTESPPTMTTTQAPIKRVLWMDEGILTEEEKRFQEEQLSVREVHREKSTLEQLSESPTTTIGPTRVTTARPRPVKHGFDRSLDEAIDAGLLSYPSVDASSQKEYQEDGNFQFQLSTFSSSATCIARTMFDLWCVCQLMTLFPYLIGVCVARRSLFVSHLVLDILILVIGFVYTITMIVFSMVLYVLVGEMPKETLFEWVLFALVLDAVLLLYTCFVVVSLRCCERIVQSRLSMKVEAPQTLVEAEEV